MNPQKIWWVREELIRGTQWSISGYSRASYRSGFYIRGLDCMLDAGTSIRKCPSNIFITHTHGDHIANIPFILLDYSNSHIPTIYAPKIAEPFLESYVSSLYSLNHLHIDTEKRYNFVGVDKVKTVRRLQLNKQDIELTTVAAHHSIPTVVYGFAQIKKKLNPQYKDLTKTQLIEIKNAGTDIMIELVENKFAYILDTSIKIFHDNPFLLTYPVIMVECTFIFDNELKNADETKHIHWQYLKPFVEQHPEVQFILIHFSLRYTETEISEFFSQQNLPNVTLWLTDLKL